MGGKSSSSSSSTTNYIDERIAATDGAIVAREGSTVSVLDGGAIKEAFQFGTNALDANSEIVLKALDYANDLGLGALKSIGENASQAFDFVDKQRQDEIGRSYRDIMPWLVGGVSVVAIAWAMKGK